MRTIVVGSIAVTSALAAGLAPWASADPPNGARVTGGGQIIASEQNGGGPGDTIALDAQQLDASNNSARGEVQYVPHASGGLNWHGTVQCLVVNGNMARIGGAWTASDGSTGFFKIVLTDSDEGAPQTGNDMIYLNPNASDSNCAAQDSNESEADLGRGNFQLHNS